MARQFQAWPVDCIPGDYVKRIHVDQHIVKRNRKEGRSDPPLTIQTSRGAIKAHEVTINGSSTLRNTPDKPLSCGAVIYIETQAPIHYRSTLPA